MALRARRWFQRLRDVVSSQARDRDMQQEMQFHLDSLAQEHVEKGTGEIGVRLALGAEPGSIAGIVVGQGATVAIAGIAVGLVAALAGGRLIESLLYGVSSRDPGVFAVTTVALLCVALLACWIPARRAARLSPLEPLRVE